MPTIPMHLDLGFALLILGVLALLAFSLWFRRFAAVCVALLVVAAGVGYMEIKREKEQALAEECSSLPAGAHSAEAWQRILKEMGGDTSGCDKCWLNIPKPKPKGSEPSNKEWRKNARPLLNDSMRRAICRPSALRAAKNG
jgi:hypothetical protein